jgi:hypothetical protein
LYVRRAEAPGPVGKQLGGDAAVDVAQPFRREGDVGGICVEQLVEAVGDPGGEPLGNSYKSENWKLTFSLSDSASEVKKMGTGLRF